MILGGYLPTDPRPEHPSTVEAMNHAVVTLKANTDDFVRNIARVALMLTRLDFEMETGRLSPYQVDALMYVRGGLDPEFASPDSRDHYVKAIITHPVHGPAAAAAFLTGWATHRGTGKPDVAWHRLIGDQPLEVSTQVSAA